jgi:hypothetical protein
MRKLINRAADNLLARFVPKAAAAAACVPCGSSYCYCSRGIAYRRVCTWCEDASGVTIIWSACTASGTC